MIRALYITLFILLSLPALAQPPGEAPPQASPEGEEAASGEADPAALPDAETQHVDPLSLITVIPGGPPVRTLMAVVDPTRVGGDPDLDDLGARIGDVLRRDFDISGIFEVVPTSTYGVVDLKRDGLTAATVDFTGWTLTGAALLVKGTYRISGSQVEIDLRLFEVASGKQVDIDWKPTTVPVGRFRSAVYDFVNAVILYYTGKPGVFGTRIVFVGPGQGNDRRIYSIDMDGYGLSRYPVPDGLNVLPTWGPGGNILFTRFEDKGNGLSLYDLVEETTTRLTDFEGLISGADYCRRADLVAVTMSKDGNSEIYTMRPDGTELTRLTMDEAVDSSPSWAPGCKKLAFVSNRGGSPQIYVMKADGSDVRRLTWVGNYNTTPEWSPLGDLIAFTARDERNRFDIFTVSPASGDVIRLTQDQGHNEEPSWSPDGRYLVFQSTRDGREPRLYLMTHDGRWQSRISNGIGYKTPIWQP